VALNPVPLMVIVAPIPALAGVKEIIDAWAELYLPIDKIFPTPS
jgi:hypothetical protein